MIGKKKINNTVIPADLSTDCILALFKNVIEDKSLVSLKCSSQDKFNELAWYFGRENYLCTGMSSQDNLYHFAPVPNDRQRILVTATQDNFHFMHPVMRLMREQGHYVTTLSSDELTQQTLLDALKHCDVAWFEWGDSAITYASKMPKYCKIVCRMHRYELFNHSYLQVDWKKIDEVIFVSEAMKFRFVETLGNKLPPDLKISVVANLTDHKPILAATPNRNPYHIACVARFAPQKNLVMLLPIMQQLIKKEPRFKIFIAGRVEDKCLYDSFKELISLYELTGNVVICGTIASNEMSQWYADKSFLLSVSYSEAHPMGIFEGMLAGLKPIVFHAPGGIDEYLPKEYLFINPEDAVNRILDGNAKPEDYSAEALILLKKRATPEHYEQIWAVNKHKSFLISIIIPCYNREKYLLPAVASALNQRDQNFEVIVVDDGSSDQSLQTIAHINDPRLIIIRKKHTNAPDTRNCGIENAKGEYIVWLDSDDLLHANTLNHYRSLLQRWPQTDVISCGLEILAAQRKYFSLYNHQPKKWLDHLPHGNFISNPGCCVRRLLYKEVGNYNVSYLRAHDYEFWSRAAGIANIAFTERCNVAYRVHEDNLTGLGKPVDLLYEYAIFNAIIQHYDAEQLFPGKMDHEIENFINQRRSSLLAACDLEDIIIVLNANEGSLEDLLSLLQTLGIQDDKKFHTIIISIKPLPFSGLPVVVCDTNNSNALSAFISKTYPGKYCRCFVFEQNGETSPHLISDLKRALINNTEIPAPLRRFTN